MATWRAENSLLTDKGIEILNKLKLGGSSITVTRIVAGSARVPESQLPKQTTVSGTQREMVISNSRTEGNTSEVSCYLENEGHEDFYTIHQIGLYVTHPDYAGEQLYLITQCDNEDADVMPPQSITPVRLTYSLLLEHGNADSVTFNIDPTGAVSYEDFEEFKAQYNEDKASLEESIDEVDKKFIDFSSGVRAKKSITADAEGNLVVSGVNIVSGGTSLTVTDAITHRALSLSVAGKTTQASTPTVASPVYPVNSQVEYLRYAEGSNTAKFISFPSVIELRSLGDYKDTIEWDGAKWWKVQRIQELVVDGTNVSVYHAEGNSSQTYCRFAFNRGSYNIVKDHLASAPIITSHGNTVSNTAEFYAFHYSSSNAVCGHFLNTVTGVTTTQTSAEKGTTINNWLKAQNAAGTPVKVYYVLKTPIVTEISLTSVLEMYANSTTISCTYKGNAPTMKLGYALSNTDDTLMYILKSLARKSEVQTANTFAVATLEDEE